MGMYISIANKSNIVRRFTSPQIRDFCNTIVDYEKDFGEPLPKIELYKIVEDMKIKLQLLKENLYTVTKIKS